MLLVAFVALAWFGGFPRCHSRLVACSACGAQSWHVKITGTNECLHIKNKKILDAS